MDQSSEMRQSVILSVFITLAFLLASDALVAQDSTNVDIVIGQPHPTLGGHIFYLNGLGGGLIVYEKDLTNNTFGGLPIFRWAEPEHLRTETDLEIYNINDWQSAVAWTDNAILEVYGDTGNYAALEIQRQLGAEWRLPTSREAYWINFHLNENSIGNFAKTLYWTSSEVLFDSKSIPAPYAVAIDMSTGKLSSKMGKIQALRVRPVRAF